MIEESPRLSRAAFPIRQRSWIANGIISVPLAFITNFISAFYLVSIIVVQGNRDLPLFPLYLPMAFFGVILTGGFSDLSLFFRRIPLDNLARFIVAIGLFVSTEVVSAWLFFRIVDEVQLPEKVLQTFRE